MVETIRKAASEQYVTIESNACQPTHYHGKQQHQCRQQRSLSPLAPRVTPSHRLTASSNSQSPLAGATSRPANSLPASLSEKAAITKVLSAPASALAEATFDRSVGPDIRVLAASEAASPTGTAIGIQREIHSHH
jgi:hypothetical protein